jgi:hypothetical protein
MLRVADIPQLHKFMAWAPHKSGTESGRFELETANEVVHSSKSGQTCAVLHHRQESPSSSMVLLPMTPKYFFQTIYEPSAVPD